MALELRGAFCHHLGFQLLQKILSSYQSSQPGQSFCLLKLGLLSSSQETTAPGWLSLGVPVTWTPTSLTQ